MTEHEKIMQQTGLEPSQCSCKTCAGYCATCPCIGTPSDILNLINNGYKDRLVASLWCAGIRIGLEPIEMVQLEQKADNSCVMYEDGKCKLHASGLKPIEGKLANCNLALNVKLQFLQHKLQPSTATALTWLDPKNAQTINIIKKAME